MWLVIIILLILCLGGLPTYSYSASWGYTPSTLLFLILIVVVVLFMMGRFRI